jgi:hypothetical protein
MAPKMNIAKSTSVQGFSATGTVNCCQRADALFDRPEGKQAAKTIVHGLLKILLASQISLRRQHRNMSEEELDLFQLFAIHVAEFCARPTEIMRSEMIQLHPLCALSNHVPYNVL